MKVLKRSLFLAVLFAAVLFSIQAYAQSEKPNSVKIHFEIADIPTIVENTVDIELCDEAGIVSFGTVSHRLKRGETGFDVDFQLPYYPIGTEFRLNIGDGVKGAFYNDEFGSTHILKTKTERDENGNRKNVTEFSLELDCYWNKEAFIKIDGKDVYYNYIIKEDDVYVPREFIEALGIKFESHLDEEKPFVKLYSDGYHYAMLYPGDVYAVFGEDALNLAAPVPEIGGTVYYPLSKVAVYFACNYTLVADTEYVKEITLTSSVYCDKYIKESLINTKNISSKTEYMIWVSKKDFEVNIFTGSQDDWTLLHTFPCSIGAPSTPTIEGQFEYIQWQARWNYPGYYCGPILRFYRGYAFHSYLIRNNGTPYDGRLRMKISHGCVRMHPDDIGWMSDNIPLYTKVYITP